MLTRHRLKAPSPALVIALLALFIALGGSSYAAIVALPKNSVGTKQLKANAVTGVKIKDGAVTAAKINAAGLTVPNATNASELGGKSANGYVPYSGLIPSGTTVTGNWYAAPSNPGVNGAPGFDEITLPAEAPTALTASTANMAAGTVNGSDDDTACTGSSGHPTAPAGKLCFYVGYQTGLTDLSAWGSNGDPAHGAALRVTGGGSGYQYARGSWAYTAP